MLTASYSFNLLPLKYILIKTKKKWFVTNKIFSRTFNKEKDETILIKLKGIFIKHTS